MSTKSNLLSQLNDRQLAAVAHTEGPLLILAGAGSGKTRTITYKIAHLIDQGLCPPHQILAVTFTNKAAAEMRSRVEHLLGPLPEVPLLSTFHSFGVRVIRKHARRLGYRADFTICDVDDQKRVIKRIYSEANLLDKDIPVDKSRVVISHAKNRGWDPDTYLARSQDFDREIIYKVYRAYQRSLRKSNAVDFDDLILLAVRLLEENEDVREYYGNRFRYLLIDEYQDTNAPQCDLVKQLTSGHKNVTAVGDEDQSIYGFRGADISNILRFETDFPGAKIIKLEQNYRSTQNILDAATAVVSKNVHRKDKVLWTESKQGDPLFVYVAEDARDEALFVASTIQEHLRQGVAGIAVLYRTNFQSRQFEESLGHFGIAYSLVGSLSFYRRKEIRDALAYLRLARNPDDDISCQRILNQPPRGIGDKTRAKLLMIAGQKELSLWQAINRSLRDKLFPARAHKALQRFASILEICRASTDLPLHLGLERILDASGYIKVLRDEGSEESSNRILNLQELITVAREYEGTENSVQEFLDQAALHADVDDYDADADVALMTLHNAKGLEFPVVLLAGCEEGLFPHSRSIAENDLEEERRLCYVGMTRAREKLYLTYSRKRRFYGRDSEEYNRPSRFLGEIPSSLVQGSYWSSTFGGTQTAPASLSQGALKLPQQRKSSYDGPTYNSVDSVLAALNKKRGSKSGTHIKPGTIVTHRKFGKGKVLKVDPSDDDLRVTVQFPGLGIKKLLQKYAKLKPA